MKTSQPRPIAESFLTWYRKQPLESQNAIRRFAAQLGFVGGDLSTDGHTLTFDTGAPETNLLQLHDLAKHPTEHGIRLAAKLALLEEYQTRVLGKTWWHGRPDTTRPPLQIEHNGKSGHVLMPFIAADVAACFGVSRRQFFAKKGLPGVEVHELRLNNRVVWYSGEEVLDRAIEYFQRATRHK